MIKNVLKIEEAGNVKHNGLNCRMRTAFKNDKDEAIYFEFHAGSEQTKKSETHYISVTHVFRLDIEKDMRANYSSDISPFEDSISRQRLEYTEANILYILSLLGLNNTNIVYTNYKEYAVHVSNGYKLGNADEIIIRG